MRNAWLATCLVAGCLSRPNGTLASDALGDGAPATCTAIVLADDFNDSVGMPCGLWGTATSPADLKRTGTVLEAVPLPGDTTGCSSTMPQPFTGAMILQIAKPLLSTSGDTTSFVLQPVSGSADLTVRITAALPPRVRAMVGGLVLKDLVYDPQMAWWRFTAGPGQQIGVDYSPTGTTWMPFATTSWPTAIDPAGFSFFAFGNPAAASGETADFDNLSVCQ